MLKELFASVGIFLASIFGTGAPIAAVPPSLDQSASAVVALSDALNLPGSAASIATTTIINQYITQPVIEREVLAQSAVTREELDASLAALRTDLLSLISSSLPKAYMFSYPAAAAPVSTQTFAHSQKINQLANVAISNATVSGVIGLTDADIPDSITASNYLPLSGGSLTFASSTRFSVFDKAYFGGTSTTTIDSTGAITVTSTSANTFPYASTTAFSVSGTAHFPGSGIWNTSGNVGIGTMTPISALAIQKSGLTSLTLADSSQSSGSQVWAIRNTSQQLQFVPTTDTGSSQYGALIITRSGSIGLGSSTPATTLSVAGSGYLTGGLGIGYLNTTAGSIRASGSAAFGTTTALYTLTAQAAGTTGLALADGSQPSGSQVWAIRNSTQLLQILPTGDTGSAVYGAFTLTRSGLLGLGSSSPSRTLTVVGGASISGNASFGDGIDYTYQNNNIVVIEGDSMSNGSNDWPGYVDAKSDLFGRATTTNVALAGDPVQNMVGEYASQAHLYRPSRNGDKGYFFLFAGGNDINAGRSAAQIYADLKSVWASARADKFKIVAFTVTKSTTFDAGEEQVRVDLNALILSDPTLYDYIIRPDVVLTDPNDATYFVDGTHTTSTGSDVIASLVVQAMDRNPFLIFSGNATSTLGSLDLALNPGGRNTGIGTTSPWRTLSVTGTVGFDGLTGSTGAGSLCLTANREVVYNSGSDACLPSLRDTKHDISALSLNALEMVDALDPVSFVYNDGDGRVRYGFIAEDTAAVDGHLVTYSASGTLSGIDDRSIISIVVKAIQELGSKIAGILDRLNTHDEEIAALKAEVAVLKSQVGAAGSESQPDAESSQPDIEPPVITINGNNPATLQIGDTYSDLGATVTDNVDLNLGLHVFIGSTPMDQAVLDTSEPNEWHVHYVATDNAGNTATSTRTVIVEAPSIVPSDPRVDEAEDEEASQGEPATDPQPAEL